MSRNRFRYIHTTARIAPSWMKISKASARNFEGLGAWSREIEIIPYNDQMARAGNGQKFRGRLDQPQGQGLKNQQNVQGRSF